MKLGARKEADAKLKLTSQKMSPLVLVNAKSDSIELPLAMLFKVAVLNASA
jgi:hypothetical protein